MPKSARGRQTMNIFSTSNCSKSIHDYSTNKFCIESLKSKNYIQMVNFSLEKKIICRIIETKREKLVTTGKHNYFAHVMNFKIQICVQISLCPMYNGISLQMSVA